MSALPFAAPLLVALALVQAPAAEQVRVTTKHANVHAGPNTTTDVLVLVPKGTVLTVVERRKPWVGVRLDPELRKTATPMRWYKNETRGFLHESYVEPAK
jgi:hypothetical protein